MEEVSKEVLHGVEIYDYTGDNYKTAMKFGSWRVAYLNYGDRFSDGNLWRIERHNESDEVFVLLCGEAVLIIGKELRRIPMEPHKIYNIPKGVWHHIFTKEGASVLIVENEDTGTDNSEYIYMNE